ncbi:MAG: metallopeptidase family protein [candidate division WOR-3 bacterium]
MDTKSFTELVEAEVENIPDWFRKRIANLAVEVRPLADAGLAQKLGKNPWSILGIYQGVPYNRRGPWYGNVLPDRIVIFQLPIEHQCRSDEEIRNLVRRVVIHEIGHYFGLSDGELHRLEEEAKKTAGPEAGPAQ